MTGGDRPALPHETNRLFLTDGGTETWLIYKRGHELPDFSAFDLLRDERAAADLRWYYREFADIAVAQRTGFIFDSLTYRASRDWGDRLGYSPSALAEANLAALDLYREVAASAGLARDDAIISGCVGPKADAYQPDELLTVEASQEYHQPQIDTFKSGDADLVTALSIGSSAEAIGIVQAASAVNLPVAVSFMVSSDGRLLSGESLRAAVESVDEATGSAAAYFMVNCSHPADFGPALRGGDWVTRIRGFRANASRADHDVLSDSDELDEGNPDDLAREYAAVRAAYPHMNVFGGCCGTDFVHVGKIGRAVGESAAP